MSEVILHFIENDCYFVGRSDFDNIDNEALDFEQLEAFIQNNAVVHSPTQTNQTVVESNQVNPAATNLPESPPDSGSEPPYSPNIKVNQSLQIDHMQQGGNLSNLSTLTELHVPPPHHHHHHHNLLTPSNDIYLANEHHQQQLLQINNILHKHDTILSSHHPPPPPAPLQVVSNLG